MNNMRNLEIPLKNKFAIQESDLILIKHPVAKETTVLYSVHSFESLVAVLLW